jgi:hypothetical protein
MVYLLFLLGSILIDTTLRSATHFIVYMTIFSGLNLIIAVIPTLLRLRPSLRQLIPTIEQTRRLIRAILDLN